MKKILIIDDNEDLRTMMNAVFVRVGYAMLMAANGKLGIELAQTELPDLIICDISMPLMDGYETLQALRADPRTVAIPLIFLTGIAGHRRIWQAMELGADDFLAKPVEVTDLLKAVESRLKKQEQLQ